MGQQGTQKATQAKAACKDVKSPVERKACYKNQKGSLAQPTSTTSKEQKKTMYNNLRTYQKKVDEFEKDVKKGKMKKYLGDMKNMSKADLEAKRQEMCDLCVNG